MSYNLLDKNTATKEELKKYLTIPGSTSPFCGSRQEELLTAIMAASVKYGINPIFILGLAIYESGWGENAIAKDKNNLFSWGASDPNAYDNAFTYKDYNNCCDAVMNDILHQYLTIGGAFYHGPTIEGIAVCYCPANSKWASDMNVQMAEISKFCSPVTPPTPVIASPSISINPPIILNHDYVNTKQYIFELRNLLTGEITWLRGDNAKKSWVAINIDNLKMPEVVWLEGKPVVTGEIITPTPVSTSIPITTDIISKVLALAESERLVGGSDVKETNGNNSGPQVDKYLTYVGLRPGQSWCAALMAWLLGQFNISNPKSGDTWEWESWASENKILFKDKPQRGDMFLLLGSDGRPTHIGLIKDIDSTDTKYLLTIEGNESDSIKNCNDKLISNCEFIRWVNLIK